ncbi:protein lin-52-like isoform X1 [Dinothrombium tinctorium]|uniref:Protein lin-52-like isoform X1 n=1 Tax=Dinothrombium tinctorium TaxID=1965070 RepID=A0A3S3NTV4_9ACAR|nr:protein lin-52-like isoform X1 [Dinothrombium tinctorium]RWS05773.1 protein lin-52-like isoform X1 [Dinothrombium tinctorium]
MAQITKKLFETNSNVNTHSVNNANKVNERKDEKTNQLTDECNSLENLLLSEECLNRASPELWPETIPGVTEFIARSNSPLYVTDSPFGGEKQTTPEWLQEYSEEDINMLHGLGSLTAIALLDKVKELQDLSFQLGLEEDREMTRAKFLNVLNADESTTNRIHSMNRTC